jgi:hypothetical protein
MGGTAEYNEPLDELDHHYEVTYNPNHWKVDGKRYDIPEAAPIRIIDYAELPSPNTNKFGRYGIVTTPCPLNLTTVSKYRGHLTLCRPCVNNCTRKRSGLPRPNGASWVRE